jgi:hypothetical protein
VTRQYNRRPLPSTTAGGDGDPSAHSESKDNAADMPALLQFPSSHPTNNWKRVKSHSSATLRDLQIEVSVENNLESLVAPDSEGNGPDSAYPSANAVIMYRIEVSQ